VASMTLERNDAARGWRARGVRGTSLQIKGSADGDNMATVNLMGLGLTQNALSGTPPERVPPFMQGWETQIAIGAFGVDPATLTSPIDGWLVNWDITVNRNPNRFYGAQNNQQASQVVMGNVTVDGSLTIAASFAESLTELNNANTALKRYVQLTFGNNVLIETTLRKSVILGLPGAWRSRDLGANGSGIRFYTLNFRGVYDPTNAYSFRMLLRGTRATAF
jgi:hypothetical protein